VNVFPLEAPTDVVTLISPVVAPTGTVQLMAVSDHEVTSAVIPLKDTVDAPWEAPKYFPLMVTVAPIVPEVGESEVMEGSFTAKGLPTDVPIRLVTYTFPVVAPTGTVQLMAVSDHEVTSAVIPLKDTVDAPWEAPKYFPLMVTVAPIVPEVRESEVMEGKGLWVKVAVTVLLFALLAVMYTIQ